MIPRAPGEDKHPAGRWDTYERLLRPAGVGRAVENAARGILFMQYTHKFDDPRNCWIRGYGYAREPHDPSSGSQALEALADSSVVPRHPTRLRIDRLVEGRWYLYTVRG